MTTKLELAIDTLVSGQGKKMATMAFLKAGSLRVGTVRLVGRWEPEQVRNEVKRFPDRVKLAAGIQPVLLTSLLG